MNFSFIDAAVEDEHYKVYEIAETNAYNIGEFVDYKERMLDWLLKVSFQDGLAITSKLFNNNL